MKAFLERFSKRTSSKKPKNLAELIQEVIEADKEVKLNLLNLWFMGRFYLYRPIKFKKTQKMTLMNSNLNFIRDW